MTSLVTRAIGITTKPKTEWEAIENEPATVQSLLTGYVAILALIPAAIGLVVSLVMSAKFAAMGGMMAMGVVSPVGAVVQALVSYGLTIGMVVLMGIIIEALAPSFDALKDRVQATKVAAYAITPGCIVSVVSILMVLSLALSIIVVLAYIAVGVWTIFIIHWGLVQLLKPPAEKAIGFTAVVIVISVVAALIIYLILGALMNAVT